MLAVDAVPAAVGGARVRRALPTRRLRTVGAWCFLDHLGPDDVTAGAGPAVGPHPHTGLQTVTWLVAGELVHRDGLGTEQPIRPGQLNVMGAGRGIAHSEDLPTARPRWLHGTQLWVAQPPATRTGAPSFTHLPELPVVDAGGWEVRVLVGEHGGVRSPAPVATPLVGLELTAAAAATTEVPLDPAMEHAALVLEGRVALDGVPLGADRLVADGPGRHSWALASDGPARVLLLGGTPWEGPLVMWWNLVGASHEEVAAAREDWVRGERFAPVVGSPSPPIEAPPLPGGRLVSRLAAPWRAVPAAG